MESLWNIIVEIQQGWKQIGIFSKFSTNIFFDFLREQLHSYIFSLTVNRIVNIVSLGIIMKYNSRNSARLKTNRNIFQIFDKYIFRLPQGTLTQLNFSVYWHIYRKIYIQKIYIKIHIFFSVYWHILAGATFADCRDSFFLRHWQPGGYRVHSLRCLILFSLFDV